MTSVTFVTAFIDLHEGDVSTRPSNKKYLELFGPLARSEFKNLIVFMSPEMISEAKALYPTCNYQPLLLTELFVDREVVSKIPGLRGPNTGHPDRCTLKCMEIQNAKTEFLVRAMELPGVERTTHYAWIDFGISKMLGSDPEASLATLKTQSEMQLVSPLMAVPGVWGPVPVQDFSLDNIKWRFCGSYFIGDVESIKNFHSLMMKNLPGIVSFHKCLTWEINYWALLEATGQWKPDWYPANHNSTIFVLPSQYVTRHD